MDAGFSIRLGPAAVRRHGRRRFLGDRPAEYRRKMAAHVSHVGVHDHGFNNVSTYGNLLRLMNEGRIDEECLGTATSTSWP